MSTLNAPTYDPTSTANSLAKAYTSAAQTLLDTQTKDAQATASALTKLQSALSNFDAALASLSSKKTVLVQAATFSNPAIASATASPSATAGTYSFFVKQLASAHQVAYGNLADLPIPPSGPLSVKLGSLSFDVDLSAADKDNDGVLSVQEIAAAINLAPDNQAAVTASTITVGGNTQLVLSANSSGEANQISLDTSNMGAGALKAALDNAANRTELVAAQDAIVSLGGENSGVELREASNSFSPIAGVSVTFKQAMTSGQAPITLTVGRDDSATASNVQGFVDAYNQLKKVLDALSAAGDPSNNVAAGPFAHDAGVRALTLRLSSIVHESTGGVSLVSYGITSNRDGSLSLDRARLAKKLNDDPNSLAQLLGSATTGAPSGVLGQLDTYVNSWTNVVTGQITQRQAALNKLQLALTDKQTQIDTQYNNAYARYLEQFTRLQALQQQLNQTSNMFDALFSSTSSK